MASTDGYTAFAGDRLIATGQLESVVLSTKNALDAGLAATVLVFEDSTGAQLDFDWRGSADDVRDRLVSHPHFAPTADAAAPRSGPGRPRLGVVGREVSLLPRHWSWLAEQPGGASAALRRLVDEARKRAPEQQEARRARDAASRFLWAIGGDLPGFEEASRALFAGDRERLSRLIAAWPADVRDHLLRLLARADGVG
jgi:uncharacterized protein